MSALCFKTRGNTAPQGKQRVLFVCHPADHAVHFDRISEKLLDEFDCSVWYFSLTEGDAVAEEAAVALSCMQLLVFPITSHLLYEKNAARDLLIPLAQRQKLPLLPLMTEDGLVSAFTSCFGDLQFLSERDDDPTALPFEEKLMRRLRAVLLGERGLADVRAAFSATVFLSYRKADRAAAQGVMRLIHQNEQCRDVAVWYDEFLVPGEDFNVAIRDALVGSDVFVLVVTPRLTQEGNYVMEVEYPLAQSEQKLVLPIEAEQTDRQRLAACYKDLPEVVIAEDGEALARALTHSAAFISLPPPSNEPTHLLCIGLAYLYGIDVERDHGRALSLITAAAEGALSDAMEKLIGMYERGEGVTRDHGAALLWRKRLSDRCRELFEEARDCESAERYLGALLALAEAYAVQSRFKEALETLNAAAGFLKDAEVAGLCFVKRARGNVEEQLAELFWALGIMDAAREYGERVLRIREETEGTQIPVGRGLWASHDRLGFLALLREEHEHAATHFSEALSVAEQRHAALQTSKTRRDLAYSLCRMGELALAKGNDGDASAYLSSAKKEATAALTEERSVEAKQTLLRILCKWADFCRGQDRLSVAAEAYADALRLAREAEEALGTPPSVRDTLLCACRMGEVAIKIKEYETARAFFGECLEKLSLAMPCGLQMQELSEIAALLRVLGGYYRLLKDTDMAMPVLIKALDLDEQVYKQRRLLCDCLHIAEDLSLLGELSLAQGDKEGAARHLRRAAEMLLNGAEGRKATVALFSLLSSICDRSIALAEEASDADALAFWHENRVAACRGLLEARPLKKKFLGLAEALYSRALTLSEGERGGLFKEASDICLMLGSKEAAALLARISIAEIYGVSGAPAADADGDADDAPSARPRITVSIAHTQEEGEDACAARPSESKTEKRDSVYKRR